MALARRHRLDLLVLGVVWVFVAACERHKSSAELSSSQAPRYALPTPTTPHTSEPSTRPIGSAVAPELPLVDARLVAKLTPLQRTTLEQVQRFCSAGVRPNANRWEVGCRACPPYDGVTGAGTAHVFEWGDPPFSVVEQVVEGGFTAAGADEVVVVSEGCDGIAHTDAGLSALKRQGADTWSTLAVVRGWRQGPCLASRLAGGRDRLVCRVVERRDHVIRYALASYEFSALRDTWEAKRSDVWVLEDDAAQYCIRSRSHLEVGETVTAGRIDAIHSEPANGILAAAVVVDVHTVSTRPTAEYLAACKRWMAELAGANPRYVDVAAALHPRAARLVFEWKDGVLGRVK
jgi:hypothetical protein